MKNLSSFNFQELIGRAFRGVRSTSCKLTVYDGKTEPHLDYHATMIISSADKTDDVIDVNIESEWFEYNNGGDCLKMRFVSEGIPYDFTSSCWPEDKHKHLPSQISILSFVISKIDIYGYNIDFNLVESTEHIIVFKSKNGQEILIKPDPFGLGLLFSFDAALNEAFFEKSPESEFIYHIKSFE